MGQGRVWKESPIKGQRELVDFPEGWLAESGTVTTGNNVDAYLDADGDNQPDTDMVADIENGRASSASQVFDFPAGEGTTGQDPRDFKAAAVTNLFYFVNTAHDYFYDLGFTEQAGNFQTDNFALGGQGNDAVRAEAQDGLFVNNASFAGSPEGMPPRLQMGIFTDDLDSDYDGEIVIHEYGHGVTTRLVGGPDNVSCLRGPQSAGLGEGWSDYFGISFYDDPVVGEYITGNPASSVRRQSYEGYTFTYEDLGNDGFDGPHDEGEIWAATLWDLRKELDQAVTDQLVVDGLKLTPCSPSMIDARDAVLMADQTMNGGANRAKIWEVFALHGMGNSASGIDGDFLVGGSVHTVYNAAFDLPPDLQPGNRNPTITSEPPGLAILGTLYQYDVEGNDPDGDPLGYELTEGPQGMTITQSTGQIQWTPSFTAQRVKVTVTDGQGGRVIHGFFIPTFTPLAASQPVIIDGPARRIGLAGVLVPDDTLVFQLTLRGGDGNPDIILIAPDGSLALSFRDGSTETLSIARPLAGPWRVLVPGSESYSGVSLEADFPVPTLISENGIIPDRSDEISGETFYRIEVPIGTASLKVETRGGEGNVDLLLSRDRVPVCQFSFAVFSDCDFDHISASADNDEFLEITDPPPGQWFITLAAFETYSGVTLEVSTQISPVDPDVTALANTDQPVWWFFIWNEPTRRWYIVSPITLAVLLLDGTSESGILWKPIHNFRSFQMYPAAGSNYSDVRISANGRTISFGNAIGSTQDEDVTALANTDQPVRWFFIRNEPTRRWYIVTPITLAVLLLDGTSESGILWKPIHNFRSFQMYPAAGSNYSDVRISANGRTISFGSIQ